MKSNNRYLGALMLAPFIVFVFLGGIYLKIFTIALSVIGMYEFYRALTNKGFKPVHLVGYILLLIYYAMGNDFKSLMFIIILATCILLIVPIMTEKYTFIDCSLTLLGFIYVGVLFSFIYLVSEKNGGNFYVWLIFIGSWMTDTAAYYAGRFLGKHKLCPRVSPKKTVEGSIGGLLGATIFCGILGIVTNHYIDSISLYHFFIIGALCGVFSQYGDLVASTVKRYVGIKDYGNIIPGHGGILDRFDSILFSGVVVFYYLTFIIGI